MSIIRNTDGAQVRPLLEGAAMTDVEKLRSIRAGLVVLRRRSADSVVGKIDATWYPADNLSKIQAVIDAIDRAISDEENLARAGAHA